MRFRICFISCLAFFALLGTTAFAQDRFAELVGDVQVGSVAQGSQVRVPFITWGGDAATFRANGGLATRDDSIFGQAGLKLNLVKGDDFVGQVREYLAGQTPFLRGTMRMLGQASEVLGRDPRTKPVVVLQLSWSAGDHVVAREQLRTLNDLDFDEGKARIACQQGGPHVGLLYDSLEAAGIDRDEIEIVWVDDITGPTGPADAFRRDESIDACCVITPDMVGLTGGYASTGTGAEGTVQGAHVLNSTQDMSRSIADVYAVRSDWFQENRELVKQFVAGYLTASDQVVKLRDEYEESKRMTDEYRQILAMSQEIFGEEVLPTLELDAHGLLLDCNFQGVAAQASFFQDPGNLSGFDKKMTAALDMATSWGYASSRSGFDTPRWDYQQIATLAKLDYDPTRGTPGSELGEEQFRSPDDVNVGNVIVSFTISFLPNQHTFPPERYSSEFQRALQQASTFGNAAMIIRGHADPTKALSEVVRGGLARGTLKRTGTSGNYSYFLNGKPLDLAETESIVKLIQAGQFQTKEYQPRATVNAALNLSLARAEEVKKSLVEYARAEGITLNPEQLQPTGAGISEPIIPKPANFEQALQNMRVEFRIVRTNAEPDAQTDFDF